MSTSNATKPISTEILLQQLRWRYAVKKFDSGRRISPEDWKALEEALILSPSSFGLQPWKFLVITNQEVKRSLVPFSWGQQQLADCSHVVVFARLLNLDANYVDRYIQSTAETRGVAPEALAPFRNIILGFLSTMSPDQLSAWTTRQIYIALGNFMTSAALIGVDTCPLEGFEPAKYDETLGLEPVGLASSVVAVAGYRAPDDKYANSPKVRFPASDLIEHIS